MQILTVIKPIINKLSSGLAHKTIKMDSDERWSEDCEPFRMRVFDPFLEIKSVRKPTKIQKILDMVPRPPRSRPPRSGFPQWDVAPLYKSLSVPGGMPKEVAVFYRDKLGNKLWKGYGCPEYNLRDPYAHDVKFFPYESCHDPYLKRYFKKEFVRNLLLKNGLITPDGKVLCTLAQYNSFRRFLFSTQQFHLHNAIWWNDMEEAEQLELSRFQRHLQHDIAKDEKRDFFREVSTRTREERELREEQERMRLMLMRARKAKRVQKATERRLKRLLQRKERSMLTDLRIFRKVQDATSRRRNVTLRALRNMHDGFIEAAFRRYVRVCEIENAKDVQAWARYRYKVCSQLSRFKREAQLLEWDHHVMEDALQERKRILLIEKQRMADMLESIQTKHLRELKEQRSKKMKEKFISAVKSVWGSEGVSPWLIEQAVISALAHNRTPAGGVEVLSTLQDIKEKIDSTSHLPEPVTYVVDILLENVIKEFIRKNLTKILNDLLDKISERIREMNEAIKARRRESGRRSLGSAAAALAVGAARRSSVSSVEGTQRRASVSSVGKGGDGAGRRASSSSVGRGDTARRASVSSVGAGDGAARRGSTGGFNLSSFLEPKHDSGAPDGPTSPGVTPPSSAPAATGPSASASGSRRRSSIDKSESGRKSSRRSSIQSVSRNISFGEVETIGKFIATKEMQPTKERPPTPVPSLEDLASAIAHEPLEQTLTGLPTEGNIEQEKLKSIFKSLQDALFNNVIHYFETRSNISKTCSAGLTGSQLRLSDVVRRMTEKIAESDAAILRDSDELHLAEEFLIQEVRNRIPLIRESSRENMTGVRRPSI